jgi:hypothetical protein
MSADSKFQISSGYERGIRFGATWTMVISPYLILYFILIFTLGGGDSSGDIAAELGFAGSSPIAYKAIAILDGLFHALFFITTVTLFAILRSAYPVRASLILVCGAWQMLIGYTKGLFSSYTFTSLGSAYLSADETLRATLVTVASAAEGLHTALQWMDSYGSMFVWILVSLLPSAVGLPRPVRWLGWIMTLGILGPDLGFLLVVLLSPFWLFLLGRWMKRLTLNPKLVSQNTHFDQTQIAPGS